MTRAVQQSRRNCLCRKKLWSRGDTRCTFVNEIVGLDLVLSLLPKTIAFSGADVLALVEPGLYSKR